jgi:hypothetical protein
LKTKHSLRNRQTPSSRQFAFSWPISHAIFGHLPELRGRLIRVTYQPELTAHRGKLLSRSSKGTAVLAGTFIGKRRIILDQDLLATPRHLTRIFIHEVFHFVWSRLGNSLRASYEELLDREFERRARGELGWSAESMKTLLTDEDRLQRSKRWREYLCESFCDTGGWFFGKPGKYSERTLAPAFRKARHQWMRNAFGGGPLSI